MEEDKKIIAKRVEGLKRVAIVMRIIAAFFILILILLSLGIDSDGTPNIFMSITFFSLIAAIVLTVYDSITPNVLADYHNGKINLYPVKWECISVSPQDIESVNIGRYNRNSDIVFSQSGNVFINLQSKKDTVISLNGETHTSLEAQTITLRWVFDMEKAKRLIEALKQGEKLKESDFITETFLETNENTDYCTQNVLTKEKHDYIDEDVCEIKMPGDSQSEAFKNEQQDNYYDKKYCCDASQYGYYEESKQSKKERKRKKDYDDFTPHKR